jgi:hypothetical protein
MREDSGIIVPIDRAKCLFFGLIFLIPTMISTAWCYQHWNTRSGHGEFVLFCALLAISAPISFACFRKYQEKKAGLTFTDEGLLVNTTLLSAKYVKWSEVEAVWLVAVIYNQQENYRIEITSNRDQGFSTIRRLNIGRLLGSRRLAEKSPRRVIINTITLSLSFLKTLEFIRKHAPKSVKHRHRYETFDHNQSK